MHVTVIVLYFVDLVFAEVIIVHVHLTTTAIVTHSQLTSFTFLHNALGVRT